MKVPEYTDLPALAAQLMQARQTVLPKRLLSPGPDAQTLATILQAAASAPDHGQLLPWQLVIVPNEARADLAGVFGAALLARDPQATETQVLQAQEKAYRSPLLILVTVNGAHGDPAIDLHERILATGCAIQNILLMATALGFGSALTSGKALKSEELRQLFNLGTGQHALCFISIGRAAAHKKIPQRPQVADYVRTLGL